VDFTHLKEIATYLILAFAGGGGLTVGILRKFGKIGSALGVGKAVEKTIGAYTDLKNEVSDDIKARKSIIDELRNELSTTKNDLQNARQEAIQIEQEMRQRCNEQQKQNDDRAEKLQKQYDERVEKIQEQSDKRELELEKALRDREHTNFANQNIIAALQGHLELAEAKNLFLQEQLETLLTQKTDENPAIT